MIKKIYLLYIHHSQDYYAAGMKDSIHILNMT